MAKFKLEDDVSLMEDDWIKIFFNNLYNNNNNNNNNNKLLLTTISDLRENLLKLSKRTYRVIGIKKRTIQQNSNISQSLINIEEDKYDYLVEKKMTLVVGDWIKEEFLISRLEKFNELIEQIRIISEGLEKIKLELNFNSLEKVVDIEEDIGIQLEL